jgi:hypothetical protein
MASENYYAEVKILEVHPSLIEEDDPEYYVDQDVLVKTEEGRKFWLYDQPPHASEEMEGKTKKLVITTNNGWGRYRIQKIRRDAGGIMRRIFGPPRPGIKKIFSGPDRINNELLLVGEVKKLRKAGDKNSNQYELVLDAGFGLVLEVFVEKEPEPLEIKEGDLIKLRTSRPTLHKILED